MSHKNLFEILRKSMEDYYQGRNHYPMKGKKDPRGLFVTIHLKGELRGCIGCLEGQDSLERMLYDYVRKAALEDPRFPPMEKEEWEEAELEITLLSPFKKISQIDEIEIGRHGLFIQKGYRSGLFLPQVPVEQGWDLLQYLEHICYKAGLPSDSWKADDASLYIFEGTILNEKENS